MTRPVAIVGDFDETIVTHRATNAAFGHLDVAYEWVPTEAVPAEPSALLARFGGVFVAPASPYKSMEGAIAAVRFARTREVPLFGVCGGFQHAILELARAVLGLRDADHAEINPDAATLAITPLACSLYGQEATIRFAPGSRIAALYGTTSATESYFCSYGVNPGLRAPLERAGVVTSGESDDGAIRSIELAAHPFFVATLFQPQMRSRPGAPHPVLAGFARAVAQR